MELKLNNRQTDNSYLEDKIKLRLNNIPKKEILNVCDAYSGSGTIWSNIRKKYSGKINLIKLDKEEKSDDFVFIGDNEKFLSAMDLSKFDVIDLDAYGIPYEQLKIIFDKKFKGMVFVTFIQTMQGGLPHGFLIDLGYTKKMIIKCPTLFAKNGFEKLLNWLVINGIKKIKFRKHARKNYIAFNTL